MDGVALNAETPPEKTGTTEKTSAIGAIAGGLLASSCCILPLVLLSIGAGGAWLSYLTALSPYQPIFLALAATSIGVGFWKAYSARRAACVIDGPCAKVSNSKLTLVGLWLGGGLALSAVAASYLIPLFY